jgi:SAM-dependent methyltransferase
MAGPKPTLECPCDGRHLETRVDFIYSERPPGEVPYPVEGPYRREYQECGNCGHWFSRHDLDFAQLYQGAYVDTSYGEGLRRAYDRIMALPPDRSDNFGRVKRVHEFAEQRINVGGRTRTLLDVGSGLAVFPAAMKEKCWDCTALDPDARCVQHAKEIAGVAAVLGDFMTSSRRLNEFDLITFNKVLEHVENPVAFLKASAKHLRPNGYVYIEVPDGESASDEGKGREEFFIEHHHVFSPSSTTLLAKHAGFRVLKLESMKEPSGKFTLYAFLTPAAA